MLLAIVCIQEVSENRYNTREIGNFGDVYKIFQREYLQHIY